MVTGYSKQGPLSFVSIQVAPIELTNSLSLQRVPDVAVEVIVAG